MIVLVGALLGLDRAFPPDLSRLDLRSPEVVDRQGRLLRGFTAPDGAWRLHANLSEVAPDYIALLTAFEDKRFFRHAGVDPLAVLRAAGQLVWSGAVVSGASTLTMQVARMLEPRPRGVRGKVIEALRAVQLERRFSKAEILEAYANLAPFGGNLHGVRAAAHAYFRKPPGSLNRSEAALLVALPQSPSRLRPDRHTDAARKARDKVLSRALRLGVLPPGVAAEAMDAALTATRFPMPMHAPHLARRLVGQSTGTDPIRTTIDGDLQRAAQKLLLRHATALPPKAGVAAVVIDNRSGSVLVHVGSADLFDAGRSGAIDMVSAVRSPGSALKPFIYGLGFDAGFLHPKTVVRDSPRSFAGYRPGNFGQRHFGEITVAEALQRSLNVPAVAVLDRLGPARFLLHLEKQGIGVRLPKGLRRPGLTVALGGLGTTLADLARLYSALARGGQDRPLRFLATQEEGQAAAGQSKLVSHVTAWRLTEIMRRAPRPLGFRNAAATEPGRIAFKTGTSYGFRDAWAIGYTPDLTVGVWVGRPDGTPRPGAHGLNAAAPIMFAVIALCEEGRPQATWAEAPDAWRLEHRDAVPEALRFLDPADQGLAPAPAGSPAPLQIVFPPDGSRLEAGRGDGLMRPLPLEAVGGQGALTWLVDGAIIPASGGRGGRGATALWVPASEGFAQITVLDARGANTSISVRIDN